MPLVGFMVCFDKAKIETCQIFEKNTEMKKINWNKTTMSGKQASMRYLFFFLLSKIEKNNLKILRKYFGMPSNYGKIIRISLI